MSVWEHSSWRRICCRLPLRPLRARPEFARLKPTPRGRSSCPTVAMASGGLFIGATRHGADGFGFGGARRTDEFEPAPVRVQGSNARGAIARRREARRWSLLPQREGRATPSEARSEAYLMQNCGAKGRFGASSPIRCVVSHRLQSADSGDGRSVRMFCAVVLRPLLGLGDRGHIDRSAAEARDLITGIEQRCRGAIVW